MSKVYHHRQVNGRRNEKDEGKEASENEDDDTTELEEDDNATESGEEVGSKKRAKGCLNKIIHK